MKNQPIPGSVIATIFYVIHIGAVWAFASGNAHLTGPDADAGSMAWIAWFFIDFPIGFIAVGVGESMPSNTLGVWAVALIGGIQWILWGLCLTVVIRSIPDKK